MHTIDKLCSEYDLTRYALSKKSGVAEMTLSNLVNRNTKVEAFKLGNAMKIAKALDLTVDELIEKLMKYERG